MTSTASTHGGLPRALIITRQTLETQAVCAHLTEVRVLEDARGTIYHQGIFGGEDSLWLVGVAEIGAEGAAAAREVERAIIFFKSQFTLFVGTIQGGEGVSLGDVVVATRVYGYTSDVIGWEPQSRPDEYRPNYTLIDRVREEVESLAWLGLVQGGMPARAPGVVLGQVAAGERVQSAAPTPTFPLLPWQHGENIAYTPEDIGFFRAAFDNNAKALLVRGVASNKGEKQSSISEEQRVMAARHASAFAFHMLSRIVPVPLHELRSAAVGLSVRSTWLAVMMALLFGVLVSLPLFCVRQKPYVKEISVGQWTVWLGAQHHKYKDHRYWVVTTGKQTTPVALLHMEPATFDGFGQATPLYWDPGVDEDTYTNWNLRPWKKVEPPESLRQHPWIMLMRRDDGSLTFPHLFSDMPKRGRGLVYVDYHRKKPVAEVTFELGSQLTIRRVFWDWKTLSEEPGPWVLRLLSANEPTPPSLQKHAWPPLLTLQQERFQDTNRWRFLDKVAGLQWPGSQWLVLRPGTEQSTQEPLGLVELEPGEGRWVKVLRLPWKKIQDFRHITVKYFDPNKDKMPDFSRFGEITGLCPKGQSRPGFGVCVETNLGVSSGARLFSWYAVQGPLSTQDRRNDHDIKGYVQLLRLKSDTAEGQALLWRGNKQRWKQLVRLTPEQQSKQAIYICRKTLSRLRKLLRSPRNRAVSHLAKQERQTMRERFLTARLLGGRVMKEEWLAPSKSSVLGRCLSLGRTLLRKFATSMPSRSMEQTPLMAATTWSERWRAALALSRKEPRKALPLLREICGDTNIRESRSMCHRVLLRLEMSLQRPIPGSWEKRLRLMIHDDPCFTVPRMKGAKQWRKLEEQLRIQDKIPYRKTYCRSQRYRLQPVRLLILEVHPSSEFSRHAALTVLGERLTRALRQEFWSKWNERGLHGVPQVLVMQQLHVPDQVSAHKRLAWMRDVAKHTNASMVLTGILTIRQEKTSLQLYAYAHSQRDVFRVPKTKASLLWRDRLYLGSWNALQTFTQQASKPLWPFLLRLQRKTLPPPSRPSRKRSAASRPMGPEPREKPTTQRSFGRKQRPYAPPLDSEPREKPATRRPSGSKQRLRVPSPDLEPREKPGLRRPSDRAQQPHVQPMGPEPALQDDPQPQPQILPETRLYLRVRPPARRRPSARWRPPAQRPRCASESCPTSQPRAVHRLQPATRPVSRPAARIP